MGLCTWPLTRRSWAPHQPSLLSAGTSPTWSRFQFPRLPGPAQSPELGAPGCAYPLEALRCWLSARPVRSLSAAAPADSQGWAAAWVEAGWTSTLAVRCPSRKPVDPSWIGLRGLVGSHVEAAGPAPPAGPILRSRSNDRAPLASLAARIVASSALKRVARKILLRPPGSYQDGARNERCVMVAYPADPSGTAAYAGSSAHLLIRVPIPIPVLVLVLVLVRVRELVLVLELVLGPELDLAKVLALALALALERAPCAGRRHERWCFFRGAGELPLACGCSERP
eukprot:scaffold293_cov248-Pinguiococcus_pyrenoidosus.AAC.9